MHESEELWRDVDRYFIGELVHEDAALIEARTSSAETVTGPADVAPNQGAFLSIIAKIAGARRVLEFGTLAGYSAGSQGLSVLRAGSSRLRWMNRRRQSRGGTSRTREWPALSS